MIEAMLLGEAAGIRELGHWSASGDSLRRASDLTFNKFLAHLPADTREQIFPGLDLSPASRIRPETAAALWERMDAGAKLAQYVEGSPSPSHSDTVVAVDRWGNMTAVTHSINCMVWGATAIIVDGVSIGDPAVNQKAMVAAAGPGGRVPDPIEVGILTRDGRPVVAFASMAMGLHEQTFQSLFNPGPLRHERQGSRGCAGILRAAARRRHERHGRPSRMGRPASCPEISTRRCSRPAACPSSNCPPSAAATRRACGPASAGIPTPGN